MRALALALVACVAPSAQRGPELCSAVETLAVQTARNISPPDAGQLLTDVVVMNHSELTCSFHALRLWPDEASVPPKRSYLAVEVEPNDRGWRFEIEVKAGNGSQGNIFLAPTRGTLVGRDGGFELVIDKPNGKGLRRKE